MANLILIGKSENGLFVNYGCQSHKGSNLLLDRLNALWIVHENQRMAVIVNVGLCFIQNKVTPVLKAILYDRTPTMNIYGKVRTLRRSMLQRVRINLHNRS